VSTTVGQVQSLLMYRVRPFTETINLGAQNL